ncbi:MAG: hypothetical protein AB7S26_03995 [Sandaracinaceae bacterium]
MAALGFAVVGCASPKSGYVFLTQAPGGLVTGPDRAVFHLSAGLSDAELPDFAAGEAPGVALLAAEGGCFSVDLTGPTRAAFPLGTVEARVDGRPIVSDEGVDAVYEVDFDEVLIAAGDSVTLSFDGSDVVSAAVATMTQPAELPATIPERVARDEELTITWPSDLDADVMELRLSNVICDAPVADGQITVSAAILGTVEPSRVLAQLIASRETTVDVEGIQVLFRTGQAYIGFTTLE